MGMEELKKLIVSKDQEMAQLKTKYSEIYSKYKKYYAYAKERIEAKKTGNNQQQQAAQ
jgi:hypothetical protein